MKTPLTRLRRLAGLLYLPGATLCCAITLSALAEAARPVATRPTQNPAGEQKRLDETAETPFIVPRPVTCESFAALVDNAFVDWQGMQGTYLIFIARSGSAEKAGLNRPRLRHVEEYLKRYKNVRQVTAEGERVRGSGRIEIYVGGKLLTVIPVSKNAATVCSGKVNPFL